MGLGAILIITAIMGSCRRFIALTVLFLIMGHCVPVWGAESSAGLFIGIGKFDHQAGLAALDYAPDDAVALAYRFVVELKRVSPGNSQLVLGGEPKSVLSRTRLGELKALGVMTGKGTRSTLQKSLEKFSKMNADGGFAVISFSGHGYETQKDIHLMPSDGNWQTVRTSGVSLQSVLKALETTRATSKLLLFDACRQVPDMTILDLASAEKMFRERVQAVPGLMTLVSCSAGEKSWQAKALEQGVFTHLVLQELKADRREAWLQLGDRVVNANTHWFQKHGVNGPTAWFTVSGR